MPPWTHADTLVLAGTFAGTIASLAFVHEVLRDELGPYPAIAALAAFAFLLGALVATPLRRLVQRMASAADRP